MSSDIEVVRDVRVPVQGGEQLAADLFMPVGVERCPAVVTFQPYLKDWVAGSFGWYANRYFAAEGFASILVDFRGWGGSTGRSRPPFDPGEADDGVAVVEWAASQPWCDGNVGMWGMSYGGITSLRTAARRPHGLGAILCVHGSTDPGLDFVHPLGRRGCLGPFGTWGLVTLTHQLLPPAVENGDEHWHDAWFTRLRDTEPYLLDMHRHGPEAEVWSERAIDVSSIDVPTFLIGGWRDFFCDATLRAYQQIPVPKKLLMGPWMHEQPDLSPNAPIEFMELATAWWRRWLSGSEDGGDEPEATVYVQGRNEWIDYGSYPAPGRRMSLWPSPDGGLQTSVAELAGESTVIGAVDPGVGVESSLAGIGVGGFGDWDRCDGDDGRSITFTTGALDEPVEISGRPRVDLLLDADMTASTLVARLCDVDEHGRSRVVCAGIANLDRRGDGCEPVSLALDPTSFQFATGHSIRLVVAGTAYPHLWPDPQPATLGVRCGLPANGDPMSALELPVADQGTGRPCGMPVPDPTVERLPLISSGEPPSWSVEYHRSARRITARSSTQLVMQPPGREHKLEISQDVRAELPLDDPRLAQVTGRAEARLQHNDCNITIQGTTHVTATEATATGEIDIDDVTAFRHVWKSTDDQGGSE